MDLQSLLPDDGPNLLEANKFLDKYQNEFIVIKIGGSVLNDGKLFKYLIEDISILKKLNFNPILVHGGGKKLTYELHQQKIKSNFIDGLRVTDKNTINIVEEVFIEFNKKIKKEIEKNMTVSTCVNSQENNAIIVKKISDELGFVGKPEKLDIKIIQDIIFANAIPIIAPLGLDKNNQVYNVNADDIASIISKKLNARRLVIISDTTLLDENNMAISEINSIQATKLINDKVINGGMIPKINNCLDVVKNSNVKGVVILNGTSPRSILFELLSETGSGTLIRK